MMQEKQMAGRIGGEALKDDISLLLQAVREAGPVALRFFGNKPKEFRKADNTVVSEADLAVNTHLREVLNGARPDYGWLSEEDKPSSDRQEKERVWVVDPIDGTRSFLGERSDWTISVALVEGRSPILGAVFAPMREELFFAQKGEGAQLNGTPIQTTKKSDLTGAKIIAGKGLLKSEAFSTPWPDVELIWVNSIAYRLCLVAKGQADAAISMSQTSDWDIAAADLIVSESGGVATDHDGKAFRFNGADVLHNNVVAAGEALHGAILERATGK